MSDLEFKRYILIMIAAFLTTLAVAAVPLGVYFAVQLTRHETVEQQFYNRCLKESSYKQTDQCKAVLERK